MDTVYRIIFCGEDRRKKLPNNSVSEYLEIFLLIVSAEIVRTKNPRNDIYYVSFAPMLMYCRNRAPHNSQPAGVSVLLTRLHYAKRELNKST